MIETELSIEERLGRIEETLNKLSTGLDQAPSMISIATDSIDELIRQSDTTQINFDDRLKNGLHLLGRLSDPKINSALNNLCDVIEQGPGLVSLTMDSLDEGISKLNQGPIKLDDRIKGVMNLMGKMSDPRMVERIDGLIAFSEQVPGLVAMTMDSVDEIVKKNLQLNSKNIDLIKNLAEALNEAQNEPPAKVGGIFGLLGALKDPGRQKALGFVMNILKNLGNKL